MSEGSALLPITRGALTSDPRLAEAVRRIGGERGFDYLDDDAVIAMLRERRTVTERAGRGVGVLGVFALLGALIPPFLLLPNDDGQVGPDELSRGKGVVAGCALLLVLGVALVVQAYRTHKRQLRHPLLAGYREVLGAARAYGAPVPYVPDWLVGRTGDQGEGSVPVPRYEPPAGDARVADAPGVDDPLGAAAPAADAPTADAPATGAPRLPYKPAEVSAYERIADTGGWHDETGFLFLVLGALAAGWGYWSEDSPGLAVAAFAPLAAVAVAIWVAGSRQGAEKEALRAVALVYVRELTAAQAAGAVVPELSPQLRSLVKEMEENGNTAQSS